LGAKAAAIKRVSYYTLNRSTVRGFSEFTLADGAGAAYNSDMRRDEVIARLKQAESAIRAYGVRALYLYGSLAHDEAGPDSDIDLFVDVEPHQEFGFDEFMTIYAILREKLGADVDYTTRDGLVEFFRPDIEKEAIRVF
jgi:predicted nucleotidyltransferase